MYQDEKFGDLVSLDDHFRLLLRFLTNYTPAQEDIGYLEWDTYSAMDYWNGVSNCLWVASCIYKIETYSDVNDDSGMWCSSAAKYDDRKAEFISQYLKEATRYLWLWMAFVQIAGKICPKYKNIKHLTSKVANHFIESNWIISDEIKIFCDLFVQIGPPSVKRKADEISTKTGDYKFYFLHLCQEMRNSMVHTSIEDIDPKEDNEIHSVEIDSRISPLVITSRLLLFTIQEMLVTYLLQSPAITEEEEIGEYTYHGILSGVKLWQAVKLLHLKDACVEIHSNQSDWIAESEETKS